ncbi:dienelactone hydrolase family protein [Lutibaculum baratangense]|uniref:Putative signal peptid-containing protein n=1 Tax=Lutibaculum baratangense AMV1 TaxID=631454 RepID=V4TM28_9HYPH|nr:dienelactone hydrolase family protein [Lutibaculum baratangense]ESR26828.1 putative signal peptid-containing protein [Lutibaculum baratangense AMV1]
MERRLIPSWNALLLRDLAREERSEPFDIEVELYLPDDLSRPVPGVVVSEGLGGLTDRRERGYGRKLAAEGYAVCVIDSFASRGVEANGDLVRALTVTEAMMLGDAFAGLRYLASRPEVDSGRVGIIGFSYGGMIATLTAYEQLARLFLGEAGPRFATHLSYYGCSIPRMVDPRTTGAPLHLLLGGNDRNVSVSRTAKIAGDLRRGGSEVQMSVFDGVYHQWDGEDLKKRFVPFNLRRLHMSVTPDHEVKDERTGAAMSGRPSRTAIIGMWTDPSGYSILRDEETTKRTEEILLERLGAM